MRRSMAWVTTTIIIFACVAWMVPPASAEFFIDAYTGRSFTNDADVKIKQSGLGNDFTVNELSFDDESFKHLESLYYGMRVGYFFKKYPWFGTAIEFLHFKMIGETDENKRITGTRGGAPINANTRVDTVVQRFDISHGVNYLTLDALFRYSLFKEPERFPHGRVQLYGGFGAGPVITHAENTVEGVKNDEKYDVGGAGVQAFVGARTLLFKHFGVFVEYKFTHSDLEVDVAGGDGHVDENTHHIVGGITIPLPF